MKTLCVVSLAKRKLTSVMRPLTSVLATTVLGMSVGVVLPTGSSAQGPLQEVNMALTKPVTAEGLAQVTALTKALNISESQAVRDVQVQDAVGNLNLTIEETLGATYAGVWFDPWRGRFEIGVAPVTGQNQSKIETLIAEHGVQGVTDFVSVRSTYQELLASENGWAERDGSLLQKEQARTMIDAATNSVVVDISDDVPVSEVQTLTQAATADTVNVVINRVPARQIVVKPLSTISPCKFKASQADLCEPPLVGGVQIFSTGYVEHHETYFSVCTAGFMAESTEPAQYPDHYLLTAAHCFLGNKTVEQAPWYSAGPSEKGHAVGYMNYHYINIGGDAAFINLNLENSYWETSKIWGWYPYIYTPGQPWGNHGWSEDYSVNIVGTDEPPNVQYQTPCHVGYGSGVTCGVTEYTNVQTYIDYSKDGGSDTLVGNLVQNSACSTEGDSGGPWIF